MSDHGEKNGHGCCQHEECCPDRVVFQVGDRVVEIAEYKGEGDMGEGIIESVGGFERSWNVRFKNPPAPFDAQSTYTIPAHKLQKVVAPLPASLPASPRVAGPEAPGVTCLARSSGRGMRASGQEQERQQQLAEAIAELKEEEMGGIRYRSEGCSDGLDAGAGCRSRDGSPRCCTYCKDVLLYDHLAHLMALTGGNEPELKYALDEIVKFFPGGDDKSAGEKDLKITSIQDLYSKLEGIQFEDPQYRQLVSTMLEKVLEVIRTRNSTNDVSIHDKKVGAVVESNWMSDIKLSTDLSDINNVARTVLTNYIIPKKRAAVVTTWVKEGGLEQFRTWYEDPSKSLVKDIPLHDRVYGLARLALYDLKMEGSCTFDEIISDPSGEILKEEIEKTMLEVASSSNMLEAAGGPHLTGASMCKAFRVDKANPMPLPPRVAPPRVPGPEAPGV